MQRDLFVGRLKRLFMLCIVVLSVGVSQAEPFMLASARKTGRKAAEKYFVKRQKSTKSSRKPANIGAARYLALDFGTFVDQESYKWGTQNNNDVGKFNFGITYRLGEWINSMDLAFRADFTSYKVDDKRPLKFSVMPIVSFPDANSGFPLYFGAGAGVGVFFKQLKDESSLSFDYSLLAGVRFFNVFGSTGMNFEVGMKSHILLLSDGQYNGVYASIGAVFAF